MKVGVPKETAEGERRVALAPEGVGKLRDRDLEVVVESGAGRDYNVDEAYEEAGAEVVSGAEDVWSSADVIAKVQPPSEAELELTRAGLVVVSFLQPVPAAKLVGELAKRGVTAISMDAIPRIARAQSMDALSSMGSIGGYKSVVIAANAIGKYLPMMTTAAGTIRAAQVLVLGAGVAGLQAIATARRLGAQVTAFDIRSEVKEQIESLGATFLEPQPEPEPEEAEEPAQEQAEEDEPREGFLTRFKHAVGANEFSAFDGRSKDADYDEPEDEQAEDDEEDDEEDTGGYAREQAEDKQEQDRHLIRERMRETDVVITTALIPGRPAPTLITGEMVDGMKPGSVIVDLAAEAGGNCELTQAGEVVEHGLVHIHGPLNLPSQMPVHASELYSRNVVNLLSHLVDEGELQLDFEDEITTEACLTHDGEVRHEGAREALGQSTNGQADRRSDDAEDRGEDESEDREPQAAETSGQGRDE